MTKPKAMPLCVADYVGDTQHLSTIEHGAYLLILMAMWRNGGRLPDDDRKLASIARLTLDKWNKIRATIRALLMPAEGGGLTQKRLAKEWSWVSGRIEKNRAAGIHGFHVKSLKTNNAHQANAIANGQANYTRESLVDSSCEESTSRLTHDSTSVESFVTRAHARSRPDRGVRLDLNWIPTPEDESVARSLGLNPKEVLIEFRDYWIGVPGARGRKVNWSATFRNRCRQIADRKKGANYGRGRSILETADRFIAGLEEQGAGEYIPGSADGSRQMDSGARPLNLRQLPKR